MIDKSVITGSFLMVLGVTLLLVSCSDTTMANWESIGSAGSVTCWSGDHKIYEGRSTGKIQTVEHSDGWEFKEAGSGDFIRVTGPCVVRN